MTTAAKRRTAKKAPAFPPPRPATAQCNHTVGCYDKRGTWAKTTDELGELIACRHCGKFYGRIARDKA